MHNPKLPNIQMVLLPIVIWGFPSAIVSNDLVCMIDYYFDQPPPSLKCVPWDANHIMLELIFGPNQPFPDANPWVGIQLCNYFHTYHVFTMCSWWWLVNPSSLLCGFIETYHHCQLQWWWHHLLVMYPLMVVTSCHWHLESWPRYDKILVFQQGALTTLSLLHVIPCSSQSAVIHHLGLTVQ